MKFEFSAGGADERSPVPDWYGAKRRSSLAKRQRRQAWTKPILTEG